MNLVKLTASTLAIAAVSATAAAARDNVQITGSSTVLPYATIVAEAFGENFDFPTPVVEGGGSGAGRAKLCEGAERPRHLRRERCDRGHGSANRL
jgi:phosphate transport system substrate-binding protein